MRAFVAAVFVLAAGIVPAGCGHGESENEANVTPPPARVKVATLRQATVPITDDYQGTIGAIESVEIRARVQGTLDRAAFQEGALVHRGDLIFQIQQNQYQAHSNSRRRSSRKRGAISSRVMRRCRERIPRSHETGRWPPTARFPRKISITPFKMRSSPRATSSLPARDSRRHRLPSTTRRSTSGTRRSARR